MAGFQQLKVTKEFNATGATIIGYPSGLMGKGRVFYVDGTGGSDTYGVQSQNPNYPMLTVTGAMDLCTSAVGDLIVIMANSPSSPPATETFPIAMDVQGVGIVGLYSRGLLSDSGIGSDAQNIACIEHGASYTGIENMYLGIDNLGSTGGVIEFNGTNSYFGCYLKNSMIESQYTATYGVYIAYDQPYYLVQDCVFGRGDLTNFTNCIRVANCTAGLIHRNYFSGSSGPCVRIDATCGNLRVLHNNFECSSDTDGDAIYAYAGSSNNHISNNYAAYGAASMTNTPFFDTNGDASNDWGTAWEQEEVTLPDSS
jgi:hypothetical protein